MPQICPADSGRGLDDRYRGGVGRDCATTAVWHHIGVTAAADNRTLLPAQVIHSPEAVGESVRGVAQVLCGG